MCCYGDRERVGVSIENYTLNRFLCPPSFFFPSLAVCLSLSGGGAQNFISCSNDTVLPTPAS